MEWIGEGRWMKTDEVMEGDAFISFVMTITNLRENDFRMRTGLF